MQFVRFQELCRTWIPHKDSVSCSIKDSNTEPVAYKFSRGFHTETALFVPGTRTLRGACPPPNDYQFMKCDYSEASWQQSFCLKMQVSGSWTHPSSGTHPPPSLWILISTIIWHMTHTHTQRKPGSVSSPWGPQRSSPEEEEEGWARGAELQVVEFRRHSVRFVRRWELALIVTPRNTNCTGSRGQKMNFYWAAAAGWNSSHPAALRAPTRLALCPLLSCFTHINIHNESEVVFIGRWESETSNRSS